MRMVWISVKFEKKIELETLELEEHVCHILARIYES